MPGDSLARWPGNVFWCVHARCFLRGARRGGRLGWALALAGALGLGFIAATPTSLAQPLGDTACSDAIDNDTDGFIDLADAGCLADLLRDDETGEIVVNSPFDKVDADPGDGLCETEASGECTVRAAIMEANAAAGEQGVQVPAGTFELTIAPADVSPEAADGDLDIADDLVLIGAGAEYTRIGGASWLSLFSDRVFEILPATQVTISGVTAQYGVAALCCGGGSGDLNGGGIFNAGTLTLTDTIVHWNEAEKAGGGILNSGVMTLTNSTVSWNYSPYDGGGIFNAGTLTLTDTIVYLNDGFEMGGGIYSAGALTITNSTVSRNHSLYKGGGILIDRGTLTLTDSTVSGNIVFADYYADGGGGISNELGTVTLVANSTVSGNCAASGGGGGIRNSGSMTLANSTVSGNYARSGAGGILTGGALGLGQTQSINSIIAANGSDNCSGSIISNGYNLADDTTCFAASGTDLVVADAMLRFLSNNGGPTETHDLLPGSPAIDAGSPGCPPPDTDQRGVARPQGWGCDIGAVEYVPEPGRWLLLAAGVGVLVVLRRSSQRA